MKVSSWQVYMQLHLLKCLKLNDLYFFNDDCNSLNFGGKSLTIRVAVAHLNVAAGMNRNHYKWVCNNTN